MVRKPEPSEPGNAASESLDPRASSNKRPPSAKPSVNELDPYERAVSERDRLASEAYDAFVQGGGLNKLPGLGKPLAVPTGSVLESIMKNANVPPPWIMLKREIQTHMKHLLSRLAVHPDDPSIGEELADLNRKIMELNHLAPSLSLHRKPVTRANLREQFDKW